MAKGKKKTTAKQRGQDNIIPHQWKPGQSGNPAGPPIAKTQLYRYLCKYLDMTRNQLLKIDKDKLKLSQRGALKTALWIADGEWQRIREIIERDEGKVPQKTELSGPEGEPIKFYRDIEPEKM